MTTFNQRYTIAERLKLLRKENYDMLYEENAKKSCGISVFGRLLWVKVSPVSALARELMLRSQRIDPTGVGCPEGIFNPALPVSVLHYGQKTDS
jgi:hypothetical protein